MAAHDSKDQDRQDFSAAGKFHNLKASDSEPVSVIVSKLNHLDRIDALDMGCGAARYDMVLYRFFQDKLKLVCFDAERELLNNLTTYLARHDIRNFSSGYSAGDSLPLNDNSMDCVLAFNTIHRYDVPSFISETVRVLKNGGYLFVHTRLRERNDKTGLGEYTIESMKNALDTIGSATVESVVFFAFNRLAAFEQMHFHSNPATDLPGFFYTPEDLKKAIEEFSLKIEDITKDHPVRWYDENVLFIIKKEAAASIEYPKVAASSTFGAPGMVV